MNEEPKESLTGYEIIVSVLKEWWDKMDDSVVLVRCKDCKWQGDDEHCPVCNSCGRGSLPSGDWYCADGERKEE